MRSSWARILRPRPVRLGLFLAALLAVITTILGTARPAVAAEPEGAKAIGVYVEGAEADLVRAAVVAALSERFRVIDPSLLADALSKERLRVPVGASLTKTGNPAIGKLRNAATAIGADAIVAGRTIQVGGTLTTALIWIDPRSPDPRLQREVTLPDDPEARKAVIAGALAPQMDAFAAASAPPPTPAKALPSPPPEAPTSLTVATSKGEGPPPPKAAPGRHPGAVSEAIVVAEVAFAVAGRRLEYTDALSPNTSSYGVFGVPMPSVGLELYPAAGTSVPLLRDLGLTMSFSRAIGISSTTSDGQRVDTTWTHLGGGLRLRFRPGGVKGAMIGVAGGVDLLEFAFNAKPDIAGSVPAVRYFAIRGGVDGRIPFWRMALLLDAGYDGAIEAGAIHDRFRGAKVGGVDFGAGLAAVLGAGFEIRLRGHYTRYFYKFHPVLGDAYVAGGALDEIVGAGLGLAYAF